MYCCCLICPNLQMAELFFQKAAHIWQLYSLLFFWLSSNSSSGAIICLCIKLGQWGTSVHGSCWLRDLGAAFRGNQRTKPWVTNWEIVLFAALWCTGPLLKQARCVCVSLAISGARIDEVSWSRECLGEMSAGRWGNFVYCVREKYLELNVALKLLLSLLPYTFQKEEETKHNVQSIHNALQLISSRDLNWGLILTFTRTSSSS